MKFFYWTPICVARSAHDGLALKESVASCYQFYHLLPTSSTFSKGKDKLINLQTLKKEKLISTNTEDIKLFGTISINLILVYQTWFELFIN